MTPTPESIWHLDVPPSALSTEAQAELAEIERQANEARAAANAKLKAASTKEADWRGILNTGLAAWVRLKNIREQLDILRQRHAIASAEFDKLVGGEFFTREWHAAQHADPLLDSWIFGTLTKEENPFVYHARTIAALETGIARAEKRLPEFERAEADARQAARDYAKANGIEHAFTNEPKPQPVISAPDASDPASALSEEPPATAERFTGKRKATK